MATLKNDRDILLQSAAERVAEVSGNGIILTYSATKFEVNGTTVNPSTITITASFSGQLYGTVTFTAESGINIIDTSVGNQCTIAYSNLTADVCKIKATINFYGAVYTEYAVIEGKVTSPGTVGTVTATPATGYLKLSWPRSPEADISGYEVRISDSGWGDTNYLFRGAVLSTLITPGTLGSPITYYVKAFDSSNLYSVLASSVTYTLLSPTAPNPPTYEYSASSNTSSTVTISWTSSDPLFGFKEYELELVYPGGTYSKLLQNPFITIDANWVGDATATVKVRDQLGNLSNSSLSTTITKSRPNAPTSITGAPLDTNLFIDWADVVKTSLPVVGYEVRTNNAEWGQRTAGFKWRGNTSSTSLAKPSLGANTYYLNSYDSDGKYASTGTTFVYTVLAPNAPSTINYTIDANVVSNSSITISWPASVPTYNTTQGQWPIKEYLITVSASDITTKTVRINGNTWTTLVDWKAPATITVRAVDVLDNIGTAATIGISVEKPVAPTGLTYSLSNTSLLVSWPSVPASVSGMPIAGYEIRTSSTGWGSNVGLVWRGSQTQATLNNITLSGVAYYISTYDTLGNYAVTPTAVTFTTLAPVAPTNGTYYTNNTSSTSSTIQIKWDAATTTSTLSSSSFTIKEYLIELVCSGLATRQFKVSGTSWSTSIDWKSTATANIYTIDVQGNQSTALAVSLTLAPPVAPTAVTWSTSGAQLTGKWASVATSINGLPVVGYELRSDTSFSAGTSGSSIWKGSQTELTLQNIPEGVYTWYLNSYDTLNTYATTPLTVNYTVYEPNPLTSALFTYEIVPSTGLVQFKWSAPTKTTYDISKYLLTLKRTGKADISNYTNSTEWSAQIDWANSATIEITTIDAIGNTSAVYSTNITKQPPANVGVISVLPQTKSIELKWVGVAQGTLPVDGYEIRTSDTNWGETGYLWRGGVNKATITDFSTTLANTWYIRAFDTYKQYSAASSAASLTYSNSYIASFGSPKFTDETGTSALVTFNWVGIGGTFGISTYDIEFTKPGNIVINNTISSTTWTTNADWVGAASLKVTPRDIYGVAGTPSTLSPISKGIPNAPVDVIAVQTTTGITLSWKPGISGTLPIAGYEVRTSTASTNYIWKGSATSITWNNLVTGNNDFYIYAYDTDGEYSVASDLERFVVAAPAQPDIQTEKYSGGASGNTVTFNWTTVAGTYDIAKYLISFTRTGYAGSITAEVFSNTWTTNVDWEGSATLSITPVDILGNAGTADTLVITKTNPTAVTNNAHTITTTGVIISWNAATKGSLPIAGYEVRKNSVVVWKGTDLSFEYFGVIVGNNDFYIYAYDTDNRYSPASPLYRVTISGPSTVTFPTGTSWYSFNTGLTTATATLYWNKPTSTYNISYYTVTFTTTDPARTLTSTRMTTDWEVPADWLGNGTLTVTAYDILGNASSLATSSALAKSLPNSPGASATPTVNGTGVTFDWSDTTKTTLPIAGYEVRQAANGASPTDPGGWGNTSGYYWKGNSSEFTVDLLGQSGILNGVILNFYIKAFDTSGRYSNTATKYSYTIPTPSNSSSLTGRFEDTNLTSATAVLSWSDTSPVFGLKHYELIASLSVSGSATSGSTLVTVASMKGISVGDYITVGSTDTNNRVSSIISPTQLYIDGTTGLITGTSLTFKRYYQTNSTSYTVPADWMGSGKSFILKTVNTLDLKSSGTTALTLTKNAPSAPNNFRAQVIDNTVLLYWDLPNITTLPISHVRIKKSAGLTGTWEAATEIGDKDGSFTTITELQGGTYTYWICTVDTDAVESAVTSIAATVAQPPDYIFNAEWQSTFNGTKTNAIVDNGKLVFPVNTTENFAQHFTNNGWDQPIDQINAGYPVFIQPGLTTGSYQEDFDYGLLLGSSQVSVALSKTNLAGNPSVSITITTSNVANFAAGIGTNVYTNTNSAFATNFRYLRILITATQNTVGEMCEITNMTVRLDAKQKTDSGSSTLVYGGAHAQGNIAQDYYTLWQPGMVMPPSGFSLNGGVSENAIISKAGPNTGNNLEPVWVCYDTDIGSDAEGGWGSNSFVIDSTKGHLFVVFAKTLTNNGTTYWGTSSNSTILYISTGAANTNPYFWNGDLPSLNTWYMLVGYVHPAGYDTTVTNVSGVYTLSNTQSIVGTDYKFANGTTTAMHRAYHYYNTGNTGQETQYMARPIVVECAYSNVPSMLSYILQCTKDYGIAVTPNNQFIDVISITATPNTATTPVTPVVDFYDIPNPTRFNIFNYTSAGALAAGSVSWSVRGY